MKKIYYFFNIQQFLTTLVLLFKLGTEAANAPKKALKKAPAKLLGQINWRVVIRVAVTVLKIGLEIMRNTRAIEVHKMLFYL